MGKLEIVRKIIFIFATVALITGLVFYISKFHIFGGILIIAGWLSVKIFQFVESETVSKSE